MPHDFDWWALIDKRAALKEQHPTIRKVLNERPGCAADKARQAAYREETRRLIQAEADARWDASVAENTRIRERSAQRAANAAYNARQRTNKEEAA